MNSPTPPFRNPAIQTELAIDVETYSDNNIKFGAAKYIDSENFEVLIISYQYFETSLQEDPVSKTSTWHFLKDTGDIQTIDLLTDGYSRPGSLEDLIQAYPQHAKFFQDLVSNKVVKTAYNAHFERTTLSRLTGKPMPAEQWKDTMILASSMGLPRSLDAVGTVLLPEEDRKLKEGKALIRFFSQPYTDRKTKELKRHYPWDNEESKEKWNTYLTYNRQDVKTEHEILKKLIAYRPNAHEETLWDLDQKINDEGVCLDIPMAKNIVQFEAENSARKIEEARQITGCTNPNSVPQLLSWLTTTANPRNLIFCLSSLSINQIRQILTFPEFRKKDYQELKTLLETYITRPKLRGISVKNEQFGPNPNTLIQQAQTALKTRSYRLFPEDTQKVSNNQKQLCRLIANTCTRLIHAFGDAMLEIPPEAQFPELNNPLWNDYNWTLEDLQKLCESENLLKSEDGQKILQTPQKLIDFYQNLILPLDLTARKQGYSKADKSEESLLYSNNYLEQLQTLLNNHHKIPILNLSKATIESLLENPLLPENSDIRKALQLRQELSKTSIKKYQTMIDTATYDPATGEYRAHDLIQFYGARTGRFSGAIIQPQNLARNTIPDQELDEVHDLVQQGKFDQLSGYPENPATLLSQLVRTAFIPAPGHTFIVSDFSAIEARALSFISGCDWRIKAFKNNEDIYCVSAQKIFNVDKVEKHGKNGELRAQGKVAELACGYGGGKNAMKHMDFNHVIDNDDRYQEIVDSWRDQSPEIPQMWRDFETAAKEAVEQNNYTSKHAVRVERKTPYFWYGAQRKNAAEKPDKNGTLQNGFSFYLSKVYTPDPDPDSNKNYTTVLRMQLPSGRCMSYWSPKITTEIVENKDGEKYQRKNLSFMVQNQTTHKWERQNWWGGTFVENACQAYCRDLLCTKMEQVESIPGYSVVFHIHDEMIVDVPKEEQDTALRAIDHIMATPVSWASGCKAQTPKPPADALPDEYPIADFYDYLPLKGGTYQCDFYRKD